MKKIRLIDIASWVLMFGCLGLLLSTCIGCGITERVDRVLTVAEDARAAVAEIKEQVEDEDWLGVTELILIAGAAAVSAFGGKKILDKKKKKKAA